MITGTVIALLVGAFLLGMFIAFVLVAPARAAMDRSSKERTRQEKTLERELVDLRRQHAQLEAEHAGVVAERDHLRQQLAPVSGRFTPASADGAHIPDRERVAEAVETASWEEQSGLGERFRELFRAPRDQTREDSTQTSDRPPAPTA